jgi:hypothetical protein
MSNPATRELRAAIVDALEHLQRLPLSDDSVHEARKSLKKARAALRLLRDGLDEAAYRAENAALRDAGRLLSPLRDPKSALAALDVLCKRYPGKTRMLRLEKLRHALGERPERAPPAPPAGLLKRSLERAEKPDFARIGTGPLERGLRRIYRQGRKAFAEAQSAGTTEAFHEWRKQVKYLANALHIVYGHDKLKKIVKRAVKLAGRLGDEHDLAVLSQRTNALKDPGRRLSPLIERRRTKLQRRSFALGKRLYRRKPGRFVERLPAATSSS